MYRYSKTYLNEINQLLDISFPSVIKVIFFILCVGCLDFISLTQLKIMVKMVSGEKTSSFISNQSLVSILIFFVFVNILRAFISFISIRYIYSFAFMQQANMFKKLTRKVINRTFENQKDLSHFNTLAKEHIRMITEQTVMAWLKIISEGIILFLIFLFLILNFPIITLVSSIIIIFFFFIYLLLVSSKLQNYAKISAYEAEKSFSILKSTYDLNIEINTTKTDNYFINLMNISQNNYAMSGTNGQSLQQSSRYLIDIILIIVIFFILYATEVTGFINEKFSSVLSIFAFAGIRALPALYQLIGNLSAIRFSRKYVTDLAKAFNNDEIKDLDEDIYDETELKNEEIIFKNYCWGKSFLEPQNLNINIKPNTITIISGKSGCGKSTLLKSLINYSSKSGDILVNKGNKKLKASLKNQIAYVGQHFTVFPGSVYENIFMGQPKTISNNNLNKMLISLNLIKFETEAAKFLQINIKENGSNLSGGELQRICVLRGLVQNKPILCLDEPTASISEQAGEDLLNYLKAFCINNKNKRVIIATHDKSIYKYSDDIIYL